MRSAVVVATTVLLRSVGASVNFSGTIASVWTIPTGLTSNTPCDPSLAYDLGCNSWWLRDADWEIYLSVRATMWPLLRSNLGDASGSSVLLYFPAFLADPIHGGVALGRFDAVCSDLATAGLRVIPFIGRPDYFGAGTANDTFNPVLNASALSYLLDRIADIVSRPSVLSISSVVVSFHCSLRCCAYCHHDSPFSRSCTGWAHTATRRLVLRWRFLYTIAPCRLLCTPLAGRT